MFSGNDAPNLLDSGRRLYDLSKGVPTASQVCQAANQQGKRTGFEPPPSRTGTGGSMVGLTEAGSTT